MQAHAEGFGGLDHTRTGSALMTTSACAPHVQECYSQHPCMPEDLKGKEGAGNVQGQGKR